MPRQRFIEVAGRRVRYLRLGEGPPVVLVHSSPTHAGFVAPQMRLLADRFTCFAFDTPGFGLSEPLPGDSLRVAQLADAIADNMVALDLPPCPMYGTHTGAAIALSLAAHRPERVTALVLDGVPIFSADEQATIFRDYFETLVPDERGGHFARTWTRFRDQYLWFPWTSRTADRHNDTDLGAPQAIHTWVESFFHAGATYKAAYRAACFYGDDAIHDSRAATCPVFYTATTTDMLFPHMDRLAPLPANQEVRPIGNDRTLIDALIAEVFERYSTAAPMPAEAFVLSDGPGIRQQYVDRATGQVLIRHAGPHGAPAILLLHDAPGSAEPLARADGLMSHLADTCFVLAPDLPGSGGSDPIGDPSATLDAWAAVVADVCSAAGVERCTVYGIGIGASLALRVAHLRPDLVERVVVRGLALPTAEERETLAARYAPPIGIDADGSHWYRTWLMLRDQQIFFPWYETRATSQRRVNLDFSAWHLHRRTFEVMRQRAHYHELIDATFAHDSTTDLTTLAVPLALCHDPLVPFFAYDATVRAARPEAIELPTDPVAHADAVKRFVRS